MHIYLELLQMVYIPYRNLGIHVQDLLIPSVPQDSLREEKLELQAQVITPEKSKVWLEMESTSSRSLRTVNVEHLVRLLETLGELKVVEVTPDPDITESLLILVITNPKIARGLVEVQKLPITKNNEDANILLNFINKYQIALSIIIALLLLMIFVCLVIVF